MDLKSAMAASAYNGLRATTTVESNPVASAIGDFAEAMQASETAAVDAMTGQGDTLGMVQALAQTELAVETAVTLRDKVVEAYQEILRMPV